jgi:hypothetical protein
LNWSLDVLVDGVGQEGQGADAADEAAEEGQDGAEVNPASEVKINLRLC